MKVIEHEKWNNKSIYPDNPDNWLTDGNFFSKDILTPMWYNESALEEITDEEKQRREKEQLEELE